MGYLEWEAGLLQDTNAHIHLRLAALLRRESTNRGFWVVGGHQRKPARNDENMQKSTETVIQPDPSKPLSCEAIVLP